MANGDQPNASGKNCRGLLPAAIKKKQKYVKRIRDENDSKINGWIK